MNNKLILASAIAATLASGMSNALTTAICTGATVATSGTAPTAGTAGVTYMATAITPKCSANVILTGKDGTNGASYGVTAASVKGKNVYGGDTASGGVRGGGASGAAVSCSVAGGCTSAEVTTALQYVAS